MSEVLLQQRYAATDVDGASAAMRAVFGVGTVTAATGAFSYRQRSLVDDGISVTRIISEGSSVMVREASSPDLVAVAVLKGALSIRREGELAQLGAGEIGLIPLGESVEMQWQQVVLDVFSFPQSSIRRILGVLDGPVRLQTPHLVARSPSISALWWQLASLLAARVLEDPQLYGREQIREQMIDALLGTTIEAFDLSNAAEGSPASDESVVARARTYMVAHIGEPVSIPDIARAAGVSVRGLQLAFQEELQTPPFVYLRELRLARARALLTSGHRSTTTVSSVARQLGYTNLGRFSAHYRAAYGESPSATLRDDVARA